MARIGRKSTDDVDDRSKARRTSRNVRMGSGRDSKTRIKKLRLPEFSARDDESLCEKWSTPGGSAALFVVVQMTQRTE
jgi:hypothetical protein